MKSKILFNFLLVFLFSFNSNLLAAPAVGDFSVYKQAGGVKLYRYVCNGSGCLPDYVLEIDLT
ncbi:conserved hypothetical protein, secreted, partial [Candidatus Magnetomorum sp. HK-1]